MHTKKQKTYPSQSSCNPLDDAIIVSHVHKTTHPLPKFRAAKPTQQIATREASPTFGHANANLNDYHYSFLQKLVPYYTVYKHKLHLHDQMSSWLRH